MSQPIPLPLAVPPLRQTRAAATFRCLGSECEDTCCGGMGVVIDKPTFEKYRVCPDPALKEVMDRVIVPDPRSLHDATYARIAPSGFCPFLTDERLCAIQQRLSDGYLSRTCATYPRARTLVDGVEERSLFLSCPEAARRVLLDPDGMDWETVAPRAEIVPPPLSTLDTAAVGSLVKPYAYFHDVRRFIDTLLRDRTYALWERIVILGMFCGQLDGIDDGPALPEMLGSFRDAVGDGQMRSTLAGVAPHPGAQVDFLTQAFDYRLESDFAAPRFVDSYREFREGIGDAPDALPAEVADRYSAARDTHYTPFMARHPHILENDVLAYAGRTLFPFGPQSGLYVEQRRCADEFALLAIRCALVRSLLVGMAGYHKETFTTDHVVRAVQAFVKAIEHDLPYQKSLLRSLSNGGLDDLPFLAVLLRD